MDLGHDLVSEIFNFSKNLNLLQLTTKETSLIYPVILTIHGMVLILLRIIISSVYLNNVSGPFFFSITDGLARKHIYACLIKLNFQAKYNEKMLYLHQSYLFALFNEFYLNNRDSNFYLKFEEVGLVLIILKH